MGAKPEEQTNQDPAKGVGDAKYGDQQGCGFLCDAVEEGHVREEHDRDADAKGGDEGHDEEKAENGGAEEGRIQGASQARAEG